MSTTDHVDTIPEGLSADYDGFITSILSRQDPYTIDDLEALHLAEEERFERHKLAHESILQVNTVSSSWNLKNQHKKKPSTYPFRGGRLQHPTGSCPPNPHPPVRSSLHHDASWNSAKPICQICHKTGHTADTCWHRYDPPTIHSYNANISHYTSSMDYDSTPSILGAPSTIEDPLWYPDTSVTHHITKDSKFFTHKQPYHGNADLKLDNKQGTSISHTGSAVYTDPHSHTMFKLHNMLHVPTITKNRISVAQFAKDNNVYFKFHSSLCYVKNQATHQILVQGVIKAGLYVFLPSLSMPAPSVFYASYKPKIPLLQLWHNRLGHCNFIVVKHILNDYHISYPSQTQFCAPCIQGKLHQLPFHTSFTQYTEPLQ